MSAFSVLESDSLDTDNTSNTAPSQPHPIKTIGAPSSSGETKTEGVVRVPEDCNTLKEAVDRVHGDDRLTTIVVGKGTHQIDIVVGKVTHPCDHLIDGRCLLITSAMNIVGDPGVPKSEIVVVGGIEFKTGIQGNCHLQHMTLRQAKKNGVTATSPFTMEDVLVEQCGWHGVEAYGNFGVGRCTNVEVRQCGFSGVSVSYYGSITLIGAKTTVHHNCTIGRRDSTTGRHEDYGLKVKQCSSATIQLVSPLTKEQVSLDNGGGGNWGVVYPAKIKQIRSIIESSFAMTHVQLASATLDATKARAVALESPLSDEDVAILGRMDMCYFGSQVPTAVGNTWQKKIAWPILRSIAAGQWVVQRGEVTEEQFSSTMELVSSMPKETIDEMLMMAKILRPGMSMHEEFLQEHYGGVEALAKVRAELQAKKDQRIAMLKGLMAAGDINATARACWKILLDQIKKTCYGIEMEVFYNAIAQIDLEGKPEWANVDFSTLIPDLGGRCPDWEPVTGYGGYNPREMKFLDPATGKVCGLRFAKESGGRYFSSMADLELVHPGGEKEVVVSQLEYED
jgi:hypothetical protein